MTYIITKQFALSYSHQLRGLPSDHPCSRVHGHNAVVTVELSAEQIDDVGFVVDYRELGIVKKLLDEVYDHRHLNDVVSCNPTSENLAYLLFWWCRHEGLPVSGVAWSETPKTDCWYRE